MPEPNSIKKDTKVQIIFEAMLSKVCADELVGYNESGKTEKLRKHYRHVDRLIFGPFFIVPDDGFTITVVKVPTRTFKRYGPEQGHICLSHGKHPMDRR